MNITNSQSGKAADGRSLPGAPDEPPDAQVIPIKPDVVNLRAKALQIIDEYDRVLQRLVEMAGRSP